MINAEDARNIAAAYQPPVTTLDTVLPVVMDKIMEAASQGLLQVHLKSIPLTGQVKAALKEKGFMVRAYRDISDYNGLKDFNGEMDVIWEEEKCKE